VQSAFSSHGLESAEHSSISDFKETKQNVKFVPTVIFYLTNIIDSSFSAVCPLIDHEFRHNNVKVAELRRWPSGTADYFGNVTTKFIVNDRTNALKTDKLVLSTGLIM